MAQQFEAVYEHGVLRPLQPLQLPEHQHVCLTLEDQPAHGAITAGNANPLSQTATWAVNERREELQWLAQESAPYAGKWVALQGARLVAHGATLAEVGAVAKADGVNDPFFASVPEDPGLPFAGW
jgi:predicted DNA-binding antitoxin AbrB/MazE fold protein